LDRTASIRPVTCIAPIYSHREQLELRRRTPVHAGIFWSPHYNIPVLRPDKLLVTIHDVLHLARPEFVQGRHSRFYARAMFEAVNRRAAAVVCDSTFTADELRRLVGIDGRKVTVVHLGVEDAWFEARGARAPYPKPYFVYVG